MNTLKIDNISFKYGRKTVYDNFSLTLKDGINVFLGPNGCGKTTLFKLLATIYGKDGGGITLNGLSYDRPYEIKKEISYLPQSFYVYPTLKVSDFLYFIARLKIDNKSEIESEIIHVTNVTETHSFMDMRMKNLSDGMRRRVGIAQALLGSPKLMIVDEPTAGLDPEQRNNFNLMLKTIAKDKIVVMSTHIIEDIHSFYDNVTIITDGRLSFDGNYEKLMHSIDGRVYTAYATAENMSKIRSKYTVIREDIEGEKIKYILVGNPEPSDFIKAEAYAPELKDIWVYYQKKEAV